MSSVTQASPARRRSLTPLALVFLCALAPVVAAFVVYENPQWWPGERNYGDLVQPQRPVPEPAELTLTTLDGQPFNLRDLAGKWVIVSADQGACPESCARKLFIARNAHASQGKNVDRLRRVWLITDNAPVPAEVMRAYEGTLMLRARPGQLQRFLPVAPDGGLAGPIWLIDPLGNLMMRFPDQADGVRVRKDLGRLLHASQIG
jgi:hypothetical protein